MAKNILQFWIFLILVHAWGQIMAISRSTVISRAETWLHPPVPYSQSRYKDGYRTDCSGYVSMAWQAGTNHTTRSLSRISTEITNIDELKSGDILLLPGNPGHVTIFKEWANPLKTKYWGYEQLYSKSNRAHREVKYWQIDYPYWINSPGGGMFQEGIIILQINDLAF